MQSRACFPTVKPSTGGPKTGKHQELACQPVELKSRSTRDSVSKKEVWGQTGHMPLILAFLVGFYLSSRPAGLHTETLSWRRRGAGGENIGKCFCEPLLGSDSHSHSSSQPRDLVCRLMPRSCPLTLTSMPWQRCAYFL